MSRPARLRLYSLLDERNSKLSQGFRDLDGDNCDCLFTELFGNVWLVEDRLIWRRMLGLGGVTGRKFQEEETSVSVKEDSSSELS